LNFAHHTRRRANRNSHLTQADRAGLRLTLASYHTFQFSAIIICSLTMLAIKLLESFAACDRSLRKPFRVAWHSYFVQLFLTYITLCKACVKLPESATKVAVQRPTSLGFPQRSCASPHIILRNSFTTFYFILVHLTHADPENGLCFDLHSLDRLRFNFTRSVPPLVSD
jgi:hypothetical protein